MSAPKRGLPVWKQKEDAQSLGVACPECSSNTTVIDSRRKEGSIRRRRVCLSCDLRFTTWEVICASPVAFDDRMRRAAALLREMADRLDEAAPDDVPALRVVS